MTIEVIIAQHDAPLPRPALTASNLSAQPGGQTAALPLPARNNIFTNVAAGTGAIIQLLPTGQQSVWNVCGTGQGLLIFPVEGMKIQGYATNVPVTIPDGGNAKFTWDGSVTFLVSGA